MGIRSDVSTQAGRLASFDGPVQVNKRRASSTKKKQTSTISWPHEKPTPLQLARAGFYYKPSASSPDSVTCFLCDKALDGWEAEDSPSLEHLAHVPDCGWAINTCIEMRSQEPDRVEEDPRCTKMTDARRMTFGDKWPHEGKKGWKCKVDKMVDAGWSYDPLPEADDCVKCFYCGVCLDGWEPKDDPWDEHQRRSPECHFFTLIEDAKKSVKVSKSSKTRASRMSKVSRLSTQSVKSDVLDLDLTEQPDDNISQLDETILTTTNRTSMVGGVVKKKPTMSKASRKTTKKASTTSLINEDQAHQIPGEVVASDVADVSVAPHPFTSTKTKIRRTTKRAASQTVEQPDIMAGLAGSHHETNIISPPAKGSRTRTARKNQTDTHIDHIQLQTDHHNDDTVVSNALEPTKRAADQRRKKLADTAKLDSSVIMLDAETLTLSATKAMRGKKRTSDGVEKEESPAAPRSDSSHPLKSMANADISGHLPLQKTTKDLSKPLPKLPEPQLSVEDGEILPDQPPLPTPGDGEAQRLGAFDAAEAADDPRPLESETSPSSVHRLEPASSPQSSDAENHPPSSRPSLVAAPVFEEPRSPVCAIEQIATSVASPSRANLTRGTVLQSQDPWSNVDLETILLASPSTRHFRGAAERTSIDATLRGLSSAEKKMSVQDWILWNARQAEDGLKGECERLINVFEREGMRALRTLEGVECA